MRYNHNRTSFAAAVAVFISFSVNVVAQEENLKHTSTDHQGLVSSLAFSPDSKTLVSGSYDRTLILRDVESGEVKKTLKGHKAFVRSVAFSPDGRTIASGADDEMTILWDAQMRTSHAVVRAIICPQDCKLAGNKIDDHSVLLWNANSGKLEMNLGGHKRLITAVAFSPNGRLVASASADKIVKLWDVSDSKTPR